MALFCGWVIEKKMMQAELGPRFFRVWAPLVRWAIPVFVGLVLVLGAFDRMQNRGWVQLPAALTGLLGPNLPARLTVCANRRSQPNLSASASLAFTSSLTMPGSSEECPASGTILSCALGHALFSFQAEASGVTTS